MKFYRNYLYGGYNGKATDDDFIIGYLGENRHYIEVRYFRIDDRFYRVDDGATFNYLKDAMTYTEKLPKCKKNVDKQISL